MKKTLHVLLLGLATFIMGAGSALAQEAGMKGTDHAWALFIGAGIAIGVAAAGGGIGMGHAVGSALEGVSRNPSTASRIMTMMILGLALIESLVIYALVVAILLLFVL